MSNYTPIPPLAQYQPYLALSRLLLGLREGEVRSFTNSDIVQKIVHFTFLCLVAKPLNRSEAKVDLVMIQTLLLFICKLFCYRAN